MAIAWRFEYGESSVIEFAIEECERRVARRNCPMDIQTYKDGTASAYWGPDDYYSFELSFFLYFDDTMTRINALAAIRVPLKFYYKKHRDDAYFWVNVVPVKTRKYNAGGLAPDNVMIRLVQTNAPS